MFCILRTILSPAEWSEKPVCISIRIIQKTTWLFREKKKKLKTLSEKEDFSSAWSGATPEEDKEQYV